MPLEERAFYTRWSRAHDGRGYRTRGHSPSDGLQSVGQIGRHRQRLPRNRFDPDLQQQLDGRAQAVDSVRAEGAGLEAPRIRQQLRRREDELPLAVDVRPAVLDDVQLLPPLRRHIKDRAPLGAAHPLVAVRGEERDLRPPYVHRQHADGLNRVYAEENVALRAELSYGVEVGDEAVVER